MTDDELAEVISTAADQFFAEVDPEETDTDDLAWTVVRAIRKAEGKPRLVGLREIAPGVHYVSKDGEA